MRNSADRILRRNYTADFLAELKLRGCPLGRFHCGAIVFQMLRTRSRPGGAPRRPFISASMSFSLGGSSGRSFMMPRKHCSTAASDGLLGVDKAAGVFANGAGTSASVGGNTSIPRVTPLSQKVLGGGGTIAANPMPYGIDIAPASTLK